jgi:hypothetical protein
MHGLLVAALQGTTGCVRFMRAVPSIMIFVKLGREQMVKKVAVVVVEFEDDENDIEDTSSLAMWVEAAMGRSRSVDVTAYSTPEDLAADVKDGHSIFSNLNHTQPVTSVQDTPAPKM